MASTVAQIHDVPDTIRSLGGLHDYVDLFVATVPRATDTSPEAWARAAIEGASPTGRFLAWRVVCRLRLKPQASPDRIAGWDIVERGADWVRLEASSSFMTASMVFKVEDQRVSFATFIRYDDRRRATLVWTPASALHRAVAPDFLRQP